MRYGPESPFWGPAFSAIGALQDRVNHLFQQARQEPESMSTTTPSVDLVETDEALLVQADLPGMAPADLLLSIVEGVLTIEGERKPDFGVTPKHVHLMERTYGRFQRSVHLPAVVDVERVTAECKNGILTITLPKKPEARPRHIAVQVK